MNARITVVILLTSLLYSLQLVAQKQELIDSLEHVIEYSDSILLVIEAKNELAYQWRYINMDSAELLAGEALQSAIDHGYIKQQGDAYMRLGVILKNQGDYNKAIEYYNQAKDIREQLGHMDGVAAVYSTVGTIYRLEGNFRTAIAEYKEGLELIEKDEKLKAGLYNLLAIANRSLYRYGEAIVYADSSITVRNNVKDSTGIANVLLSQATIYMDLKDYDRANDKLEAAKSIYKSQNDITGQVNYWINRGKIAFYKEDFETAIQHYGETDSFSLTPLFRAEILSNIGICYQRLEITNLALQYFEQSLDLYKKSENTLGQAQVNYNIGETYRDRGDNKQAIPFLRKALSFLPKSANSSLHLEIYFSLAESLAAVGAQSESLDYYQKHLELRDASFGSMNDAHIYQLNYEEEKNRVTQLQAQNKILATESELQTTKNAKQMQLIYLLSGIFLLTVFAAGIAIALNRQRYRSRMAEAEIDHLLQEQEIKAISARIEGQEEERQRVAQDLHDRIGGMLSTVKLYFSTLDNKIDILRLENREQYQKANYLLDETVEEVRRVARNMASGTLTKFGLPAQLKELTRTIEGSKQIEVEMTIFQFEERLDDMQEVKIYRIIQELVSNALKHAKAGKLSIHLNRFDDIVNVQVEDNGIGFDPEIAKGKNSMGLSNIKARVHALNGNIQIDSVLGRGTAISVDIPVKVKKTLESIK